MRVNMCAVPLQKSFSVIIFHLMDVRNYGWLFSWPLSVSILYVMLVTIREYTCGEWPSWSYGRWIYNYPCNQCLSQLTLWDRTPLRQGVLDTTLCDKVCQWLATNRWFSSGNPVSSTNKTNCQDITEILLKVALNTINLTKPIRGYAFGKK